VEWVQGPPCYPQDFEHSVVVVVVVIVFWYWRQHLLVEVAALSSVAVLVGRSF